jgi:hypothetical protein
MNEAVLSTTSCGHIVVTNVAERGGTSGLCLDGGFAFALLSGTAWYQRRFVYRSRRRRHHVFGARLIKTRAGLVAGLTSPRHGDGITRSATSWAASSWRVGETWL